jgi:hypothetical protein
VLAQSELSGILACAETRSSRELAAALIEAVLAAGEPEQDNTSVIVIKIEDPQVRAAAVPALAVGEERRLWSSVSGLFGRPTGLHAANTAKPQG